MSILQKAVVVWNQLSRINILTNYEDALKYIVQVGENYVGFWILLPIQYVHFSMFPILYKMIRENYAPDIAIIGRVLYESA